MGKLNSLIKDLESKIEFKDVINLNISKSDVAWHIDHSLKVINSVITVLKKSNPEDYKWKLNFKRSYFFLVGYIPRGRATAPKFVQSLDAISLKDIHRQLETGKFLIDKKSNLKHPFVGLLNLKQAKRFLVIHTHHHLKIIDDILNK
jgi:hypothetical protein